MNERDTEDIVRKILVANKNKYQKVKIKEQQSTNPRIQKLLKNASKSGKGGSGSPEFIITFDEIYDLVIIIECKADVQKHESKNRDKPKEYAVDGVIHYASHLSKKFDVIAVAVSGQQKSELKISTFLQLQSQKIIDKPDKQILGFEDYISLYKKDPEKERLSEARLLKYAKTLNIKLRDEVELEEGQRPLLVSGILIALENHSFADSYMRETLARDLAGFLIFTIKKVLDHHEVDSTKRDYMMAAYNFLQANVNIAKDLPEGQNTKLRELIYEIEENVKPFMRDYRFHDVLGQFYGEFLRYVNWDRGLGIILTPRHVTELFVDIANVDRNSVVIDNCCGTGGFLISSMKKMVDCAGNDSSKKKEIYNCQLIGIENNSKMFCLSSSNMLLRGDGKSNIYHGSCFTVDNTIIKELKPTVGLLNPPYAKKSKGAEELNYVSNCMEFLEKNATCVAILPISSAIKNKSLKSKLLENHTLEAVMSMPDELFYPIGVVSCIMVFKAHVPHKSDVETWFGYWKDDGFIKTKHEGRMDKNNKFANIRRTWMNDFRNRLEADGRCVKKCITSNDEWLVEAYMNTDYSLITEDDFTMTLKKYMLFKQLSESG